MTDEFDEVLIQLEPLRFTPDRSGTAVQAGLQAFLTEAASLRPTVSARPAWRLTGWMSTFTQERSPMFALAIKFVLVLSFMLGGTGATAAAAQSSLPNEALYPIKLLVEEAQSLLATGPDAQIDTQLDHAQQRVREMAQLAERGAATPADVPARLQAQLQAALQIAAQLDDQHLPAALDRIQLRTQDQLREIDRLHLSEAVQALTQTRELVRLGQNDPQQFRARFGHGRPDEAPPQPQIPSRADPSRTPQPSCTPQNHSYGPGPRSTAQPQLTNTPQNQGYGPGPLSTQQPVATPVGQGDGHEYGPGLQATDAPGGGGETQGNQSGNGPGTNASPEPGGNDNCGNGNGGGNDNGGGNNGGGGGSGRRP